MWLSKFLQVVFVIFFKNVVILDEFVVYHTTKTPKVLIFFNWWNEKVNATLYGY